MSDSNKWRAARIKAGLCVDCSRPKDNPTRRCDTCNEKNGTTTKRCADLLRERQLSIRRCLSEAKEADTVMAEPRPDIGFIRSQTEAAVPLLARLYEISEAKVWAIRGRGGWAPAANSQRMPLKLLEELVEQRTGKYHIDHFIRRESSIALCARDS